MTKDCTSSCQAPSFATMSSGSTTEIESAIFSAGEEAVAVGASDGPKGHSVPHEFPEGGLRAWLVVFGCWCISFASFGYVNSFGSVLGQPLHPYNKAIANRSHISRFPGSTRHTTSRRSYPATLHLMWPGLELFSPLPSSQQHWLPVRWQIDTDQW